MMLMSGNSERYYRNTLLPGIGEDGQEKLLNSSVLIIGLGGLGCPVSQYLTAAGVGHIGLCDYDVVSLSNLQRQILFREDDVGRLKVEAALSHLSVLNSNVSFSCYDKGLTPACAADIIRDYDVVVDCSDNFSTRYLISDTCKDLSIPWIFGSIGEFVGQLSTFLPDSPLSFSDLYPDRINLCSQAPASGGVLGALAGTMGSLQAAEVLKLILGIGQLLSGRLLVLNLLTMIPEIYLL